MRTVLRHCFGLQSGSIYVGDFEGNEALAQYVGHLERLPDGTIPFAPGDLPLIKTHERPDPGDLSPAIYVVRDGRAASMSFWSYDGRGVSLDRIVTGRVRQGSTRIGTWSNHILSWQPWSRPNTILVKYEDLVAHLPGVVDRLSRFLGRQPIADRIPPREDIAAVDGRWVRSENRWEDSFPPDLLELFKQHNGVMMQRMGYGNEWGSLQVRPS